MNRLQAELRRLYALHDMDAGEARLLDAHGQVRAMVLELARPADWAALAKVWAGVQSELHLPAPAIAVSGSDGYQLWFSLAQAQPMDQATAFLKALSARYLSDVAPDRIKLIPAPDQLTASVPPQERSADQWSAFVAPDLAPVFSDTPWLDIPPSPDGQADLLAHLASIKLADFQAALAQLTPREAKEAGNTPLQTETMSTGTYLDPKRFLLDVMNNGTVAWRLRIEAAKALLPYLDPPR